METRWARKLPLDMNSRDETLSENSIQAGDEKCNAGNEVASEEEFTRVWYAKRKHINGGCNRRRVTILSLNRIYTANEANKRRFNYSFAFVRIITCLPFTEQYWLLPWNNSERVSTSIVPSLWTGWNHYEKVLHIEKCILFYFATIRRGYSLYRTIFHALIRFSSFIVLIGYFYFRQFDQKFR